MHPNIAGFAHKNRNQSRIAGTAITQPPTVQAVTANSTKYVGAINKLRRKESETTATTQSSLQHRIEKTNKAQRMPSTTRFQAAFA